ncbi:PREDICTED: pectin acetylesterase 8-like [Ipomoea nil]|uniref:pectin acetylesterase 8-like n=1 Tax=Ipomoea nil TaxID=35883 RepID=UPI000900B43E|nr:PREDICTED: pectin acetylesterase 8-like [Ipomoea nil]
MEEFKAKGMGMAKNAIFAGNSAGGVAVMLHYDRFGALFPNTTRVKCLANSSYFIDVQKLDGDKLFQFYEFLVGSVGSAKWIPQQCTSRMKPSLCFFPQNSLQYVNTPIFLTMSSFDQTQLKYGLSMSHEVCVINNNCTLNEIRRVKELRLDFLSLLPKTKSHSSIAIWVNNCTSHEFTYFSWYGSQKLKVIGNKTYGEVFVDWYFDQNAISPIQIIDKSDKPVDCSAFGQRP